MESPRMFRCLCMSLLAAAWAASGDCSEAQADACSEDPSWGAGWLQENYAVSQRIATDAVSSARVAGPLTDDFSAADFTEFAVPFGTNLALAFVVVACLLIAHEIYVHGGQKPLLADHVNTNNTLLQSTFLVAWFVPFISVSLVVPLSLDYAIALGQSATGSGVFLGGGTVFSVVGLIAGKALTNETNWDQRFARQVFVMCMTFAILGDILMAVLNQHAVHWSLPAKKQWFWWGQLLMGVINMVASLPTISWNIMWNKITPSKEKTFWMILAQCCRNGGFILGPPAFGLISSLVRQGRQVSPICMMAWSFVGILICCLVNLTVVILVWPTELHPEPEVPETEANKQEALEAAPEELIAEDREKIVKHMILYSFERPFSIAAIEVATIMLLEVSYGWSAEFCGFAFIVIAAASLCMTACSTLLLSRRVVTESMVFFVASVAGLCGVLLLFNWHFFGNFGAASLLLADAIVYGGASVANGIGEGWGCRAATPGTSYSIEYYRLRNILGVNVSRFAAPIAARFILDYGGRNIYAVMQLFLCSAGTWTVYKTVSLVWKGTRASKSEDAMESKVSLNTLEENKIDQGKK